MTEEKPSPQTQTLGDDPFDLGSFMWGMLAGGVITVAVGGVILYFAAPYLMQALGLVGVLRKFEGF